MARPPATSKRHHRALESEWWRAGKLCPLQQQLLLEDLVGAASHLAHWQELQGPVPNNSLCAQAALWDLRCMGSEADIADRQLWQRDEAQRKLHFLPPQSPWSTFSSRAVCQAHTRPYSSVQRVGYPRIIKFNIQFPVSSHKLIFAVEPLPVATTCAFPLWFWFSQTPGAYQHHLKFYQRWI